MVKSGFELAKESVDADVIFLNTCAIRENAEQKIWHRLAELKSVKTKRKKSKPLTIGVLGCMAERLKEVLLSSDKGVDVVAGPDAYRDLPSLLTQAKTGAQVMNVMLSQDETYADVSPVRTNDDGVSAYVSIMRGCNNMCTYCIVPFTRGRERSRPVASIVKEIKELSQQGYKEVVLLGQNVNSYNDTSETTELKPAARAEGFETVYRVPQVGLDFTGLVDIISKIDPEIRIRFTSPHPKDFPDSLIDLIASRHNVCKSIHIPAQSGSTQVLEKMRRGYTSEAYLNLIKSIRAKIPDISLSSDFISGFCGETEEDHLMTIDLLKQVEFDEAFMFAYSSRDKTPAARKYVDDVDPEVKSRRLREVIDTFYPVLAKKNEREIGKYHLVLAEKEPRKPSDQKQLKGRSDTNKKVVFNASKPILNLATGAWKEPAPGDYVIVKVTESTGVTLVGDAIAITNLQEWAETHSQFA